MWCQMLGACNPFSLQLVPVTCNVQRCARMISMRISCPRSFMFVTFVALEDVPGTLISQGVPAGFRYKDWVSVPWCLWRFFLASCTCHTDFAKVCQNDFDALCGPRSCMFVTHFPWKLYLLHGFCKGLPEWFRCIMWCQILSACDLFCLQIVPVTQVLQRFARMISMQYVVPDPCILWPFFLDFWSLSFLHQFSGRKAPLALIICFPLDFDTTFGSQNLCACDPFAMQIVSLLALTAPLCLERPKNKVLSRIRSFSLFFCRGHGGFLYCNFQRFWIERFAICRGSEASLWRGQGFPSYQGDALCVTSLRNGCGMAVV